MKTFRWLSIVMAFLIVSCGNDEVEKREYTDGVVIVNQGAFQTGTGTLTFKGRGVAEPVQNIYSINNEGAFLGNIAQSIIEHNGRNYISINNGGRIIVTEKDDFTFIDTIVNVFQGRYFASNQNKLFVSSWGMDGVSGSVQELNTSLNEIDNTFDFGNGPEGIIFVDDLLYIARGGGFGLDSLLTIVNIKDNSILKTLIVGDNPEFMVKDKEDNIYLICNGFSDFFSPELNTPGHLLKIKDQEIIWSIEIPNGSSRLAIDRENEFLYFNSNGNVVKQDLNSAVLEPTIIHEGLAYALGFDEVAKQLYIGDAKDFASQGEVFVYSKDDNLVERFACGVIPSYFHFK